MGWIWFSPIRTSLFIYSHKFIDFIIVGKPHAMTERLNSVVFVLAIHAVHYTVFKSHACASQRLLPGGT